MLYTRQLIGNGVAPNYYYEQGPGVQYSSQWMMVPYSCCFVELMTFSRHDSLLLNLFEGRFSDDWLGTYWSSCLWTTSKDKLRASFAMTFTKTGHNLSRKEMSWVGEVNTPNIIRIQMIAWEGVREQSEQRLTEAHPSSHKARHGNITEL